MILRRAMANRAKTGWMALALFALAACDRTPPAPPPPCPDIVIVQDAAEVTQFLPGPGRDLTDVTLEAQVAAFRGFCDTDIGDDGTGAVDVELELLMIATRGPAAATRDALVSYFVAIADKQENVLARAEFESAITFECNRNRIGFAEELTQRIPLDRGQLGDDYSIFVGFVLTDEDLRYNRNKRGR